MNPLKTETKSKIVIPRKLVFLDVDGTLLNVRQKTNAQGLPALIKKMSLSNFQFGLNSNRSLEDVLPVIRKFNLTGPFILENGAYILKNVGGRKITAPGLPPKPITAIKQFVLKAFKKFPNFKYEYTDTTRLVRNNRWPDGNWFFLNKNRKYSASIHNRINGVADFKVALRLTGELNKLFGRKKSPFQAHAGQHGSTVTIGPKSISKSTALDTVNRLYPDSLIIAIGDGEADLTLHGHVDRLYAVSNAVPQLKQAADYTAKKPMTAGVKEILILLQRGELP